VKIVDRENIVTGVSLLLFILLLLLIAYVSSAASYPEITVNKCDAIGGIVVIKLLSSVNGHIESVRFAMYTDYTGLIPVELNHQNNYTYVADIDEGCLKLVFRLLNTEIHKGSNVIEIRISGNGLLYALLDRAFISMKNICIRGENNRVYVVDVPWRAVLD